MLWFPRMRKAEILTPGQVLAGKYRVDRWLGGGGMSAVYQGFHLAPTLTVAENVALGISPELARDNLAKRIVEVSEYYGLKLEPGCRHA